jgi:2-dehydropantoate 2-reductase
VSLDDPVIAVIGAGALGGYYGARLIQHGHRVHLLTRTDCDHIRRAGMQIHSRDGDFSLRADQVHVYDDVRGMPKVDWVIVTLKTTANDRLAELVGPVLKEDSVILTLQNGLGNEELLGELFGAERIVGGMAYVCINRVGPGEISHTDHGMIRLGDFRREPGGGISGHARRMAELFTASGVPCDALSDLARGRWDKLIWNVPFNGLGAALDMATDRLIGSNEGLRLVQRLMEEVIATCGALNIHFNLNVIEEKIRYTQTMGSYKTSMQIDRKLGHKLETEAILGRPIKEAKKHSIETPYMEMLYGVLSLLDG